MALERPKYIIIDTCIIQHANNPGLADGIGYDLQEAYASGYTPAISHFTYFELLDGAFPDIELARTRVISGLRRFRFQERIIRLAARLACFYRNEGIADDRIKKLMKDRIIGATCVLSPNSILYTANANDFPQPFFEVFAKRPHIYRQGQQSNDRVMYTYFIRPDYNAITVAYKQWNALKTF